VPLLNISTRLLAPHPHPPPHPHPHPHAQGSKAAERFQDLTAGRSAADSSRIIAGMQVEVYQLTGLALAAARRFVQAGEMFGRAEAALFDSPPFTSGAPGKGSSDSDCAPRSADVAGSSQSTTVMVQGEFLDAVRAALHRASSLCLLAGDGLSHVNQLPDRLVRWPLLCCSLFFSFLSVFFFFFGWWFVFRFL